MIEKRSDGARPVVRAKRTTRTATTSKAAAAPAKAKTSAVSLPHEMIARRAYEIWQAAVRRAGQPSQHWVEAEAQLRAEMKKSARASRPARVTRDTASPKAMPAGGPMPEKSDTRLAA